MATRPGARSSRLDGHGSRQMFSADGDLLDAIETELKANARPAWHADRSLSGNRDLRFNDVFVPVAFARGNIPGKAKVRQRGQRDVMCAADTGFQHAAAPHRKAALLAQIVDLARDSVSAHATQLDVDDLACAEHNRGFGLLDGVNALVEANRGVKLLLQGDVAEQVIPTQRLLD